MTVVASTALPSTQSIPLQEWRTGFAEGVTLTDADRRLCANLAARRQIVVEEMRAGLRIETRGWVGAVHLENIEIHVTPKLAGDAIGVARLLAFTRGIGALERRTGDQSITTSADATLLDLFASLLADEVERVVTLGLYADYVSHEDELPAMRGRFLPEYQLLKRLGRLDKVWCRFDELESDTDENRMLGLALSVAVRRVSDDRLRRRLRYLAALFDEICDPGKFQFNPAERPSYHRQNEHYRDAHELARLILTATGIDDLLAATGHVRSFAFLLDMNSLFEDFVGQLLDRLFPPSEFRVEPQQRNWSVLWNAKTKQSYRSIRPDVVVQKRDDALAAVAVDAKYKRYDLKDASSPDLYQGLLYAQAYRNSASAQAPTALLVYPGSSEKTECDFVHLRQPDGTTAARLLIVGLPVRQTLETLGMSDSPGGTLRKLIIGALGSASPDFNAQTLGL